MPKLAVNNECLKKRRVCVRVVIGNRLNTVPGMDHVKGLAPSELHLQHHWNISSSPDDKYIQTGKNNFKALREFTANAELN